MKLHRIQWLALCGTILVLPTIVANPLDDARAGYGPAAASCPEVGPDLAPTFVACNPRPIVCVDDSTVQHHVHLFYAQRRGTVDRYNQTLANFRYLLLRANGIVDYEAFRYWGVHTGFKVLCDGSGLPTVTHVLVDSCSAPSCVNSQLVQRGLAPWNSRAWILDQGNGAWGQGNPDNSPGLGNANNRVEGYATVNGVGQSDDQTPGWPATAGVQLSMSGLLHEGTHSMGAVHVQAPHSNYLGHCNDGHDVMCYPDAIAVAATGTDGVNMIDGQCLPSGKPGVGCATHEAYQPDASCPDYLHYDCNHDDYFNIDPPACLVGDPVYLPSGCYLRDHWNLGSPSNLFIKFSTKKDPVSILSGPATVKVGHAANFNGSASYDPDGKIVYYSWTFGDGVSTPARSDWSGNHIYVAPGSYQVQLLAVDDYEGSSRANWTIQVAANVPPISTITGPGRSPVNASVAFDGSASSDPDGRIQSYRWTFGDGSGSDGAKAGHVYAAPDNYTVTLTTTDDDGATTTSNHSVTVSPNVPPLAFIACPSKVRRDAAAQFDGTKSHDPDGQIVRYAWTFSDGAQASGPVVTHQFATSGREQVQLSVTDTSGASTETAATFSVLGPFDG